MEACGGSYRQPFSNHICSIFQLFLQKRQFSSYYDVTISMPSLKFPGTDPKYFVGFIPYYFAKLQHRKISFDFWSKYGADLVPYRTFSNESHMNFIIRTIDVHSGAKSMSTFVLWPTCHAHSMYFHWQNWQCQKVSTLNILPGKWVRLKM